MRRYLEYRDPDGNGFFRRLTMYERGRHSRLLTRLSDDWWQEGIGYLKQRGAVSPDPHARLLGLCGDHLRHALRVDVILDRAARGIEFDLTTLAVRDLLAVGEITAAASWVPEATTLLVLALSRGWIGWDARDRVIAAIQALPPELRWPTSSNLFCFRKVSKQEALAQAAHRFGIGGSVRSVRDVQIMQRKIAIRLRGLRKNPSRSKVKAALYQLVAER